MPPEEVTSDVAPLIQRSNSEEVVTSDEVIGDPNATHGLVHDFVEFDDRLIEAEIDTGEIQPKFSWRKLWKYTGPGNFFPHFTCCSLFFLMRQAGYIRVGLNIIFFFC